MATKSIDPAALRLELARVLQSRVFERAQRSQRFLRYVVEAALADPLIAVKEYTLAFEVFDRDASYDPSVDATVRVEASRLRARLREYYAEEGRHDPWQIEVPKGGYSIVFTPRVLDSQPAKISAKAFKREGGPPRTTWRTRLTRLAGTLAAGLLLLLFLTRRNWNRERNSETSRDEDPLEVRSVAPVTTEPGIAQDPAISPDGTELAYSWDGEDGISHIYLKSLAKQQSFSLTHNRNPDRYPVWSPDGKEIAFARSISEDDLEIMRIPARGGSATTIRKVNWGFVLKGSGSMLSWTPDGQWLCFPDRVSSGLYHLFLISLQTGFVKPLSREESTWNEGSPAFSLNGQLVAFAHFYGVVNTQIVIAKVDKRQQTTGEPTVVSDTGGNPSSPVWLKDGRLVFVDGSNLMQTSFARPAARRFYAAISGLRGLSYDSVNARLITSRWLTNADIWTVPLKGTTAASDGKRLLRSTAQEEYPAFSPDGKWLVFVSNRGGTQELWLADADGRNPHQLTRLSAYIIGFPHWSADSKSIAFHARLPKRPEIYLLRLEDNSLRALTDGEPGFFAPSFSRDGKSVYCAQLGTAGPKLYKVDIEGGSQQVLWEGVQPVEAPGRNTLLYLKDGQPGIFERSLSGEPQRNGETRLVDDSIPAAQSLSVTTEGIFYTSLNHSTGRGSIRFYSFKTRRASDVAPVETGATVTLKPDRTSLAYDGNAGSESQLLEIKLQ